jgi:uncharacterized caspase-like protein
VALVIGNDRYANLPANEQLQKAGNDARAVGGALRQIGFEVIPGENLGRRALVGKLNELVQRLAPGDVAFFFFSGHGLALDGVNYILPADVPDIAAGQETSLKVEALSEQYIVSELTGRGIRVAVVVLDACRTNPFSRPGGKGVGVAKGLAPPPQVQGVLSLYAAASGQAALYNGDPDPNSVFSRVLVPALTRPGLDMASLAIEVREEVARISQTAGHVQRPAYYDETIGGRLYLAGAPPAAWGEIRDQKNAAVRPGMQEARDDIAWRTATDTAAASPDEYGRKLAYQNYLAACLQNGCKHGREAEQGVKEIRDREDTAADSANWERLSAAGKYQEYKDTCREPCAYRKYAEEEMRRR